MFHSNNLLTPPKMHCHFQRDIKYFNTSFTRQTQYINRTHPYNHCFHHISNAVTTGLLNTPQIQSEKWVAGSSAETIKKSSSNIQRLAIFKISSTKSQAHKRKNTLKLPIRKKNINKNNDKLAKTMPNLYKHPEKNPVTLW